MIWFRRRAPAALVALGARPFFCFSLRTELLPTAVQRCGRLLAALEGVEDELMSRADVELLSPVMVRAIVNEVVRVELARILASDRQAQPRSGEDAEAAVEAIEQDLHDLRKAGRRREYDPVRGRVDAAVERLRLPALEAGRLQVDRAAHAAMIQAREVELAVEEASLRPAPQHRSSQIASAAPSSNTSARRR